MPGPDQIVACPSCRALAKHMTLASGNTFGARAWTDGKQVAPMLPCPPAVVRCHSCAACYWLTDAEKIGTVNPWYGEGSQVDPAWATAPEVHEPTEDEYYDAVRKGLATDAEQQLTLRILAWWRRNDTFRDPPQGDVASIATGPGLWRENLEALVSLLDEADENKRLMKAEALRELGEFESAQQILGRVASADYAAVVRQLRSLCGAGDACVRELQYGG